MNATEAKRKLCEIRSNLTDNEQKQAIWEAIKAIELAQRMYLLQKINRPLWDINSNNMKYKFTVVIESYDDSEDRETVKDCLEEWLEMNCGEEKDLGGYPDWKTAEVE